MTQTTIEPKPEERDVVKPKPLEAAGETPSLLAFPNPSGGSWKREDEKPKQEAKPDAKPTESVKRRGRPPGRKTRPDIRKAIETQLVVVGLGVSAFNQYDGRVIIQKAPEVAKSLEALAMENEAVRRALEMALTAGAWSQVLITVASVAVPIAANHGLAPEHLTPLFGMEKPSAFADKIAKAKDDTPAADTPLVGVA